MTIQVKVKNLDSRAEAIIAVKVQDSDGKPAGKSNPDTHLKGGEEVEKYVHSTQRLVVEEVKNG